MGRGGWAGTWKNDFLLKSEKSACELFLWEQLAADEIDIFGKNPKKLKIRYLGPIGPIF